MNARYSGQTLVEVLVALSAVLIILGAVTGVVLLSLKQSVGSSDLTRASQLARDGMEIVQGQTGLLVVGKTSCLDVSGDLDFNDNGNTCRNDANLDGKYSRSIRVESDPEHCSTLKKVTVEVLWNDSACPSGTFCHKVPLTTCL